MESVEEISQCSQAGKTANIWWFGNFDTFSHGLPYSKIRTGGVRRKTLLGDAS
jgi:hypothetical protein